ncbi:MAG: transaldolase [Chloroflexi bacterium]|nr:transaldolase [Chloroflexota bacterium]
MITNPLKKLQEYGQSIWLDYIQRSMLDEALPRLIAEDGIRGVTSNPSILYEAISSSADYDQEIRRLARAGKSEAEIYDTLALEDVGAAADLFRPMFDESEGRHGFVSLEVSPHLAYDTQGTIAEARRYWAALGRPNILIKVPATAQGLPAIRQLLAEGINVNVTLLFGLPRYRQVLSAFLAGLEDRLAAGKPLAQVASVASFFLSRIDVLIDPRLETRLKEGGERAPTAKRLLGQVAIASARRAYQIWKEVMATKRWLKLAEVGARPQRLLWASTSTKNPAYSDVKYVEALIGPDTVNTLPLTTIEAYRDHGQPAPRLEQDVDEALWVLDHLPDVGIDIRAVTQQLEDEGVQKFVTSYDQLLALLRERRAQAA